MAYDPFANALDPNNLPNTQTQVKPAVVNTPQKELKYMTVAEAQASGQTEAYNKLVASYMPQSFQTNQAINVSSLPTNKKPPIVPVNDTSASNALDIAALKAAESAMMKSEEDAKLAGQKAKEKTPAQTIADRVMDITGSIGKKSEDIEDLQAERDIAGKTEAVNKINSEIMITDRAYEKRIREIEKNKQGTFGGAVDQEVMRIKKQRNEDLADLSIQKAVALGDLETANNIIDTAIKAKYEPLENELKTLQTAFSMYQDDMSASEKQAASEAFTLKREETSRKNDLQSQALKMAQETGQYDVASGLLRLDPNSPTFDSDLASLTSRLKASDTGVASGGFVSSTAQAIIDNPNLFNSLTATEKGKVLTELSSAGYDTTPLGLKPLAPAEVTKIAETQKALSDIQVLTSSIDKNLQYIGPVSGFQALNPWSKARQLQADIDRVKQTIGKALEGGVLRKEDEEKYKKILPTVNDTEETARYKLAQLNTTLQADLDRYTSLLQSGGRATDVNAALTKKGSENIVTTKSGNSYTITKE